MTSSFCDIKKVKQINDPGYRGIVKRVFNETASFITIPSFTTRYLVIPIEKIRIVEKEKMGDDLIISREIDTPKGRLKEKLDINSETNTIWHKEYPESLLKI